MLNLKTTHIKLLKILHQHDEVPSYLFSTEDRSIPIKGRAPMLRQMVRTGLITARLVKTEGGWRGNFYKITDEGRAAFANVRRHRDVWWWLTWQREPEILDTDAPDYPYQDPIQKAKVISILKETIVALRPGDHVQYPYDYFERLDKLHEDLLEASTAATSSNQSITDDEAASPFWPKSICDLPDEYKKTLLYKYVYLYFRNTPELLYLINAPTAVGRHPQKPEPNIPVMDEDYEQAIARFSDHLAQVTSGAVA